MWADALAACASFDSVFHRNRVTTVAAVGAATTDHQAAAVVLLAVLVLVLGERVKAANRAGEVGSGT